MWDAARDAILNACWRPEVCSLRLSSAWKNASKRSYQEAVDIMNRKGAGGDQAGVDGMRRFKLNECIARKNILIALANILLIAGLLLVNYGLTYYSDLKPHVAKWLAFIFFVSLLYFGSKIFSTSKKNKLLGYGGILTIIIVQSFILWRGTASHLLR
jgi:hypothetical protein